MTSRVIRIDVEVKAMLDAERRPDERNYNGAILRIIAQNEQLQDALDSATGVKATRIMRERGGGA